MFTGWRQPEPDDRLLRATSKSVEKLGSGQRINSAADDTAGLAISEKMRAQIRGLQMASKNSQYAMSLVQTGANQGDSLSFNIKAMNATAIGVKPSDIKGASAAITKVTDAINEVSTQRSEFGALQKRLEFNVQNPDISSENLQASESRIRDVDTAKEMTVFTKHNILAQTSTAMLTQANALPQGVLQLIGG